MKKITIAIIICAAVFVLFGALSAWAMSSYDFSKENERGWKFGNFIGWNWSGWGNWGDWGNLETRSIDKTLEAEGINFSSVNVSSVSSNITVTQGSKLTARLYGEYASRGEIDLVMTEIAGVLTFKVDYPNNIGTMRSNLKLDVTIPADYIGDLDIDTVSGDINTTLTNSFSGFFASTTSGSIRCGDITAGSIKFNSVSGSTYAGNLIVDKKVSSDTISGGLEINMLSGGLDAGTVSGEVRANIDAKGNCDINTTSGSVNIGVPQDAKIVVDYGTVSGSFDSELPLTYEKSSRNSFKGYTDKSGIVITVDTVSGSFNLKTIN